MDNPRELSAAEYKEILDHSPSFTYVYDVIKYVNVYSNLEISQTLGYAPNTFAKLGDQLFATLIHPDDLERVAAHHQKVDQSPDSTVLEIEYRIKHSDGSWRLFRSWDKVFQRTPDGRVKLISGSAIDVTQQRQAEQRLKESEANFRSYLEYAPSGILVFDSSCRMLEVNKKACEILGYSEDALISQGIGETMREVLRSYDLDEKYHHSEQQFMRSDGVLLWLSMRTVYTSTGRFVSFFQDISQRKNAEIELAKYKQELELTVKSRTDELEATVEELNATNEELYIINDKLNQQKTELETTLEQLQDTQTKLIEAEKMASLGVLTAGVAHEINNPLNFITSGVTGLKQYLADVEQLHVLFEGLTPQNATDIIRQSREIKDKLDFDVKREIARSTAGYISVGAERILNIVNSLRSFSRSAEASRQIDLHQNIETALVMLQHELKMGIKVVKLLGDLPKVVASSDKISQVFLNIIANAVQAMEQKGTLTIRTFTSPNKEQIFVAIRDTGVGMDQETKSKVFEPFFTTKEVGKGIGLGLYICYNIVKEHNGHIDVFSEPGKGSEFIVRLPVG